jgi:hypothetical protein
MQGDTMTDARQPVSGAGTPCPDFESVSCYADGELEPVLAASIASHVESCAHCGTLAARLREGLTPEDARRDGGIGGSGCADEEYLVLYATGTMNGTARTALQAHLDGCDACIRALTALHRRLSLAAVIESPVPFGIQQRARLALEAARPATVPVADRPIFAPSRGVAFLDRLRGLLRVPVLVPAAMAAGALLMVTLQPPSRQGADTGELDRAIAPQQVKLRVTAVEATVRSRPSMQSLTLGTVHRGAMVEVAGQERDWYEVRLDGGQQGWVEREAFE